MIYEKFLRHKILQLNEKSQELKPRYLAQRNNVLPIELSCTILNDRTFELKFFNWVKKARSWKQDIWLNVTTLYQMSYRAQFWLAQFAKTSFLAITSGLQYFVVQQIRLHIKELHETMAHNYTILFISIIFIYEKFLRDEIFQLNEKKPEV